MSLLSQIPFVRASLLLVYLVDWEGRDGEPPTCQLDSQLRLKPGAWNPLEPPRGTEGGQTHKGHLLPTRVPFSRNLGLGHQSRQLVGAAGAKCARFLTAAPLLVFTS